MGAGLVLYNRPSRVYATWDNGKREKIEKMIVNDAKDDSDELTRAPNETKTTHLLQN